MKRKITVLVNDLYPGTTNPLIYDVEVNNIKDDVAILAAVTEQRVADLGGLKEGDKLELELVLAFPHTPTLRDWRY